MTRLLTLVLALTLTAAQLCAQGLALGEVAPDFSLRGTDGAMHGLSTAAGEAGTLVVFTCNTCPYAVAYEDRLVALAQKLQSLGYGVIAVQPNDTILKADDGMSAMKLRAAEKQLPFAYVLDAKQEIYRDYGATRTPHFFLLDAENRLRYVGALDDNTDAEQVSRNYLLDAALALTEGRSPEPASTKAIGCGIKTKK